MVVVVVVVAVAVAVVVAVAAVIARPPSPLALYRMRPMYTYGRVRYNNK